MQLTPLSPRTPLSVGRSSFLGHQVTMPTHKDGARAGQFVGYAFILYASATGAAAAVEQADGGVLNGRDLQVGRVCVIVIVVGSVKSTPSAATPHARASPRARPTRVPLRRCR